MKARPLLTAIGAPSRRSSRDAARGRRGRAAASSIRTRRCCTPTTRRCCAAARSFETIRVYDGRRSGSTRTSTASPARPSGSGCRAADAAELERSLAGARCRRRPRTPSLRLYWTPDARLRSRPSARARSTLRRTCDARARDAGSPAPSSAGRRAVARRREVDELRGQHGGAGRRRRGAGADDALSSSRGRRPCSRAPTANVWWRRGAHALSRRRSTLRILAGVTRAALARARAGDSATTVEEGVFRSTRLLAADEAFLARRSAR